VLAAVKFFAAATWQGAVAVRKANMQFTRLAGNRQSPTLRDRIFQDLATDLRFIRACEAFNLVRVRCADLIAASIELHPRTRRDVLDVACRLITTPRHRGADWATIAATVARHRDGRLVRRAIWTVAADLRSDLWGDSRRGGAA
jgi:hypothetical protein